MLLVLQFGVTSILVGLIWTIQWVHYPLLLRVGPAEFASYHREHCRRIAWLVIPLMLAEATLAAFGLALHPWEHWLVPSLIPLAIVWGVTGLISAPLHKQLAAARSDQKLQRLVTTNWIRTFAWSARAALLIPTLL